MSGARWTSTYQMLLQHFSKECSVAHNMLDQLTNCVEGNNIVKMDNLIEDMKTLNEAIFLVMEFNKSAENFLSDNGKYKSIEDICSENETESLYSAISSLDCHFHCQKSAQRSTPDIKNPLCDQMEKVVIEKNYPDASLAASTSLNNNEKTCDSIKKEIEIETNSTETSILNENNYIKFKPKIELLDKSTIDKQSIDFTMPPQQILELNTTFRCTVTHIENPLHFYVSLISKDGEGERMLSNLNEVYDCNFQYTTKSEFVKDMFYACIHDNYWMRVKFVDPLYDEDNLVQVYFIDRGFQCKVPFYNLSPLHFKFYKQPPMAYRCHLYNVFHLAGETGWTSKAIKFMKHAMGMNGVMLIQEEHAGSLGIEFTIRNRSINDKLVSKNLASKKVLIQHIPIPVVPSCDEFQEAKQNVILTSVSYEESKQDTLISVTSCEKVLEAEQDISLSSKDSKESDEDVEISKSKQAIAVPLVKKNVQVHLNVPPQKDLKMFELLNCYVSYVDTPSEFFIMIPDEINDKLVSDINDIYKDDEFQFSDKSECSQRFYVSLHNDKWSRVMVTNFLNPYEDDLEVLFMDVGEKKKVHYYDLKPIISEFCSIPAMAYKCHLYKIVSTDSSGAWTKKSIQAIKKMALHKHGTIIVEENQNHSLGVMLKAGNDQVNIKFLLKNLGYELSEQMESRDSESSKESSELCKEQSSKDTIVDYTSKESEPPQRKTTSSNHAPLEKNSIDNVKPKPADRNNLKNEIGNRLTAIIPENIMDINLAAESWEEMVSETKLCPDTSKEVHNMKTDKSKQDAISEISIIKKPLNELVSFDNTLKSKSPTESLKKSSKLSSKNKSSKNKTKHSKESLKPSPAHHDNDNKLRNLHKRETPNKSKNVKLASKENLGTVSPDDSPTSILEEHPKDLSKSTPKKSIHVKSPKQLSECKEFIEKTSIVEQSRDTMHLDDSLELSSSQESSPVQNVADEDEHEHFEGKESTVLNDDTDYDLLEQPMGAEVENVSLSVAVQGYSANDEAEICKLYKGPPATTCFKGSRCKKRHEMLNRNGWTVKKIPVLVDTITEMVYPDPNTMISIGMAVTESYNSFYGHILPPDSQFSCLSKDSEAPPIALQRLIYKMNTPAAVKALKTFDKQEVLPGLGELVMAFFRDDCQWYRAKVIDIEEDEFEVLYIDFGNKSKVEAHEIATMEMKYAELPAQAVKFVISNIYLPMDSIKRLNAAKALFDMILDKRLNALVLFVEVFEIHVIIWDYNLVDIGQTLAEKGLVEIKPYEVLHDDDRVVSEDAMRLFNSIPSRRPTQESILYGSKCVGIYPG